jgi:hypothetical protein
MHYTDLELREIRELSDKIKERNDIHVKNIKPITDDMIHLLHHDESLKSVYNKKTILVASIQTLVNKYEMNDSDEKYLDKRLFEAESRRRKSRCEACAYSKCIIL